MSNSSLPSRSSLFTPDRLSWILAALAALFFSAYYIGHTVVLNEADPRLLAHFQGHKPYQLRVLLPLLLLALEKCGLTTERGIQLLGLSSALALAVCFRLYLRELLPIHIARFAALALWPPLFLFYSHRWYYLYDVPSVAFLCLGLYWVHRENWRAFALTLAIASFNRESSILLVVAYALAFWAPNSRAYWVRLIVFTAIWGAIKATLGFIFATNPGAGFERHWNDNWIFLSRPQYWPSLFITSWLLFIVLLGTALYFWRWLPRLLQATTLIAAAMPLLFFIVGVIEETRLLGETIPLLLPPVLFGFWKTRTINN